MMLIAIVVAMGSLAGCGEAGTAITRLAVGDPGPDAYTLVADTDDPQTTRRMESGGERTGDQPGLYGGTRKAAICDKDKLIKFLGDNLDKATAWANVHRITPAGIPAFVEQLTPVVLRVDTLVTNHGYRSGEATSMPAVLQAGVGVLVDSHGLPVVKCNCGNPLTAPDKKINAEDSSYKGVSWPEFSKTKVTTIEAPAQEVKNLMLVDPDLGMIFSRPTGTEGESDGNPVPVPPEAMPETATPTIGPSGTSVVPTGGGTPTGPTTPGGSSDPGQSPSDSQAPSEPSTGGEPPVVTDEPRSPAPEPEPSDRVPPPEPSNDKVPDVPKSESAEPPEPRSSPPAPERSVPPERSEDKDVPKSEPADRVPPPETTPDEPKPEPKPEPAEPVAPS
jgi:hypothetical protein